MSRFRVPILLAALVLVLIPLSASAAVSDFFGSIVPDVSDSSGNLQTCAAGWQGLIVIINNLIKFAIYFGIIVAVLTTAYGGFLLVLSPTNPENRSKAKSLLINAALGLLLALSAWLIVNTIIRALSGEERDISYFTGFLSGGTLCYQPVTGTVGPGGYTGTVTGSNGATMGTRGCPSCTSLQSYGVPCKNGCTLDATVAPKIGKLKDNFSGSWEITEAYPPSQTHSNSCHSNGTCIDAAFRGNTAYTGDNIAAFASAAKAAGLNPVFETRDCSLKAVAVAKGVTAYCSSDPGYSKVTGNHFSVYAQ